MHFVYMTTNKINGKKYIGKHSGDPSDSYIGSGAILRKAIEKYGKNNFEKTILITATDEKSLDYLERCYIEKYDAIKDDSFYNLAEGGNTLMQKTLLSDME